MTTPTRLADSGEQDVMRFHLKEQLSRLATRLGHVEDALSAIAMGQAARIPREECKELDCVFSGECHSTVWQCAN